MPGEFSQIGTYLLAALIVFAIYRRLRRSFGRQPLRPGRMLLRIVLLSLVGIALAPAALRSGAFAAAAASGLAAGLLLAFWGASQARFEQIGTERFYLPHTYTGIAVSLLFMGRVVFRLLQAYGFMHGAGRADLARGAAGYGYGYGYISSPLTLGLFYVLVGYWVAYLTWILWKCQHLPPGESVQTASPLGAGPGAPS
jgi:hypothetical protein